jgi:hypothetical protein
MTGEQCREARERRALELAGVIFVEENGEGPGVRLRKVAVHAAVTLREFALSYKSRKPA